VLVAVGGACSREGLGPTKPTDSAKPKAAEGMPLANIQIDPPTSSEASYRVDNDALLQVLLLALDGALPVTRTAEGNYRVNRAAAGSVLALAGLRVADEVIAVNGVPLSDRRTMSKAYPLLKSARAITLSVRRGGEVITLNYRVRRTRSSRIGGRSARRPPSSSPLGSSLPRPRSRRGRLNKEKLEALKKQIKRIDDTHFEIKRALLDEVLRNQAELMRSARIVPEAKDGKVVGIRLYGIRQSSVLRLLGFKNGDSIQTINGKDITSPEKALKAYGELRTAKRFVVKIVRRGKPLTLHIRVVP